MTNLLDLLGMLRQDAPDKRAVPDRFVENLLSRMQPDKTQFQDTPSEVENKALLRMGEEQALRQILETSEDPEEIGRALEFHGIKPTQRMQGGEPTPGVEYPYPNLWDEIHGRQQSQSQREPGPAVVLSKPIRDLLGVSDPPKTSPAGFDPREAEASFFKIFPEMFTQKRHLPVFGGGLTSSYKAKVAAVEGGPGPELEHEAYIPTEDPAVREPEAGEFRDAAGNITPGQAPKASTKPEPSGGEKVDVKSTNLPGMGDPTYQKWVKDSERLGITLSEHVRNEIAREMGLEKSDINEKISQLSQRLLEALDRKPGWPEILMAWGLMLMGQDGVGFVQQLNQSRLGQVSALQTALQGARGERGRREALGASYQQAQMTRATALQEKQFGNRDQMLSEVISGEKETLADYEQQLKSLAEQGGTRLKGLLGYPGTAKDRAAGMSAIEIARMQKILLNHDPIKYASMPYADHMKAAIEAIEFQRTKS